MGPHLGTQLGVAAMGVGALAPLQNAISKRGIQRGPTPGYDP